MEKNQNTNSSNEESFIPLNTNDPTINKWKQLRDFAEDKREPGLIHVQRFYMHYNNIGIPTFFHLPIALTPEDLKVGQVEVAIMGADLVNGIRARTYGPQEMRNPRLSDNYLAWGEINTPHMHVMVDPFKELKVADYGDAPVDPMSIERSAIEVRKMVREIASVEIGFSTHIIPIIIGGCHALMYPDVAGIVDVYGRGNVGVIHFDAHVDTQKETMGHVLTHGNPVWRLIDDGLVEGNNFIQIGLRGYHPDEESFRWAREEGMRYHTMVEVEHRGWRAVMEDIIKEAQNGPEYLFISFDLDCMEPVFMPGTHTPEPGGLTIREVLPIVRRLCAETKVVGFDLVELKPVADPTYVTMLNCNRIIRECMTGLAMRKKGLTEPHYLSPLTVDDGRV